MRLLWLLRASLWASLGSAACAACAADCDDVGARREALELLQRRSAKLSKASEQLNASREAEAAAQEAELGAQGARGASEGDVGTIFMIYTYGAVATSTTPLEDLSQQSRTFRGLRCFTENLLFMNMKQTDAGANLNKLYHSKVPTMVLRENTDSEFYPEGRPDLPGHDSAMRIPDVGLHDMTHYFSRLERLQLRGQDAHAQKPFASAYYFAYLAWGAYERQSAPGRGQVTMESLISQYLPSWQLVAQEQQDTLEAVDNLWIVQNKNSKDCVLVFEGTHTVQQFGRNLKADSAVIPYCGFPAIHPGYATKLRWLMKGSMPKLRPKLAKCYRVGCTGHSLGGALCEIFAACANSAHQGDADYEALTWQVAEPELMPQMAQKPLSKDNLQRR